MAKKPAESGSPVSDSAPSVRDTTQHSAPVVEAGETRKCTSKADAMHAIDELGYPVMVDGVVHEKKVWAIGAVEKVFGEGKGSPGECVVARPKFV